jgi:hypothetical protein
MESHIHGSTHGPPKQSSVRVLILIAAYRTNKSCADFDPSTAHKTLSSAIGKWSMIHRSRNLPILYFVELHRWTTDWGP